MASAEFTSNESAQVVQTLETPLDEEQVNVESTGAIFGVFCTNPRKGGLGFL